ncbi:amino acid permease-domain-containing protein [Gymnopilus junonius]|uniref:Amino acid permease-domain-containing protein n=1 Tax=Gymnopilus junonius TaxID=109634 RepID=A0A9P5TRB7_GYMJU|nr:amino acid permease-domain-containing protein [Gymnopilus junonius]
MNTSSSHKILEPLSPPVDYGSTQQEITSSNSVSRRHSTLQRGLSARQVQMIAIAGTIGTGLFLGTGRSLAQGGPASMLICYSIVGFIVYITLLLLGEMATQYPVAGSFNAYATRFFSPAYGFALAWNYWFNDAVSVASDLTAAQLVLQFWSVKHPWIVSIVFWVFLVGVNSLQVRGYGELEYWLSSLKVVTVVAFIVAGLLVDVGVNSEHRFIGFNNWRIPGAPFVGGFGGFARVFVTASFAFGGTESLGITAGETKNPSKNMPRVVNLVFWRIMIFYILTVFMIGLNVPWDYPNLSNRSTATSPFTIVFVAAGSSTAASFMNTVILTSVLSAGNHALFAGTRVLYGLSVTNPPQAPKIFSWTSTSGTPIPALLMTSSISGLCFLSSFIGSGELWGWLQNIVGVSNQIAWLSIGLSSWRFRKAWLKQGRSIQELKFRASWTWPWGPHFVVVSVTFLILVQGWSSLFPAFSVVDFVSFYIELPIMAIMFSAWIIFRRSRSQFEIQANSISSEIQQSGSQSRVTNAKKIPRLHDLVDISTVNLYQDEYVESVATVDVEDVMKKRIDGKLGILWRIYYFLV